jgi:hypothetical protein
VYSAITFEQALAKPVIKVEAYSKASRVIMSAGLPKACKVIFLDTVSL